MSEQITFNNQKAIILPFDDPINPSEYKAWVLWNGNRSLYSSALVAILKFKGYIIEDLRNKEIISLDRFEEF